jgi:hypothetical protein
MQVFTEPRFTFQDPVLLVLVCITGLLAVRLEFFILRALGVQGATAAKRKIAGWLTVIILTCVPLSILAFVSVAFLVFALSEGVAVFIVMYTEWGRRSVIAPRMRSRIRTLLESAREPSPIAELPWSIKSWVKGLEEHGFSLLDPGHRWEELSAVMLGRPTDGTIAGIIVQPTRWLDHLPMPFVQLVSVTQGHGGALSTGAGSGPEACLSLIPQVVQFSTPSGLLRMHEEGRRLLEARGIRFKVVPLGDGPEEMWNLWHQMLSALLQLPPEELIRLRPKLRRKPISVASSLAVPEIVDRIDKIRVAGSGHGDVGARSA